MNTRQSVFLASIALWLLPVQVTADEHPVLGQGNIPCSAWLEGRQSDHPNANARIAWVLGFMTAFNQYASKSQADVSEGKGTEELTGWIDNYCRQHQGDNLHGASAAFIDEFVKKTRK